MAFLITHSLLSSWLYSLKENPFSDASQEDTSKEDFLRVLRREKTPTTEAMQNGIDFENLVTGIALGQEIKDHELWLEAAGKIADIVRGGQFQYVSSKYVTIDNMDIFLYGRFDVLKAGTIYDIKFTKNYERGKFFDSTQHPMYFELMPEADVFTYLVSNGVDVWKESYRRDETKEISQTVSDFLWWLNATGNMEIFKEYWRSK